MSERRSSEDDAIGYVIAGLGGGAPARQPGRALVGGGRPDPAQIRITSQELSVRRIDVDTPRPRARRHGDRQAVALQQARERAADRPLASSSARISTSGRAAASGTYFLPKGRLVVAGSLRFRLFYELAVVGGTGLYNDARGTLVVTRTGAAAEPRSRAVPPRRLTPHTVFSGSASGRSACRDSLECPTRGGDRGWNAHRVRRCARSSPHSPWSLGVAAIWAAAALANGSERLGQLGPFGRRAGRTSCRAARSRCPTTGCPSTRRTSSTGRAEGSSTTRTAPFGERGFDDDGPEDDGPAGHAREAIPTSRAPQTCREVRTPER